MTTQQPTICGKVLMLADRDLYMIKILSETIGFSFVLLMVKIIF